jgi:hypothetical protein
MIQALSSEQLYPRFSHSSKSEQLPTQKSFIPFDKAAYNLALLLAQCSQCKDGVTVWLPWQNQLRFEIDPIKTERNRLRGYSIVAYNSQKNECTVFRAVVRTTNRVILYVNDLSPDVLKSLLRKLQ